MINFSIHNNPSKEKLVLKCTLQKKSGAFYCLYVFFLEYIYIKCEVGGLCLYKIIPFHKQIMFGLAYANKFYFDLLLYFQ